MTSSEVPDVSIVIAVYNTMPYLTECLTSLVEQTIGHDALEVIAVDDGSTDGSAAELDRFAALHPTVFTVIHQDNSGGPAAPSNRALGLARGRYVFFVGADDVLGVEALERLVARGDALGADVMVGRMVGTNGRWVNQALYKESRDDVTFTDSALPFTLANTKLFRRSLIEEHAIRFPEDLPVGSDQPFTIEACFRARRIAVLGDYTCYYATRREDAQNITYRTAPEARLAATGRIMDFVADLIPAGPDRSAVLARHFAWELPKLLTTEDLDGLPLEQQERLIQGIGELVDRHWAGDIKAATPLYARVRLALAQAGSVELVREAIAAQAAGGLPVVAEGTRAYFAYPGMRDPRVTIDDATFDVGTRDLTEHLAPGVSITAVALGQDSLRVTVSPSLVSTDTEPWLRLGLASKRMPSSSDKSGGRRMRADETPELVESAVTRQPPAADDGELAVEATIDLAPYVEHAVDNPRGWGLRLYAQAGPARYELPVLAGGSRGWTDASRLVRRRLRAYEVVVRANDKGRVVLRIHRVSARELVGRARPRRRSRQANPPDR